MTSFKQVIKSVGPKLVPFFKTVAVYFVIFMPQDVPSVVGMVLKCLPIISLMIFVLLHGMSLGDQHKYSRKIILGLIFGCIGDACLIWPQYFTYGMLAFGIGHIHYIRAFGFKPLNIPLAVVLYAISVLGVLYLLPGLKGEMLFGVPVYTLIITTMLWRATARVQFGEDLWTWSKLCTCAGGVFFVISDLIIALSMFRFPINNAQVYIMSTYYAAQLGISLSVVDAMASQKRLENEPKITKLKAK